MTARPIPPNPLRWRTSGRALAACVAALAFGPPAWAESSLAEQATAALAGHAGPPRAAVADAPLTLRSEELPLFTDMASAPSAAPLGPRYTEMTGWLTPDQPASLGVTLGVLSGGGAEPGAGGRGSTTAPLAYDLGVRWRSRLQQRVHLDVQAWTRAPQPFAAHDALGMVWSREPASVGTRLEVQWKPSRTGRLVPEFGAIGVQLQGDARLLLRAKHGGPMVYYRAKF